MRKGRTPGAHGSHKKYFIALALFAAAILTKTVTATLPAALLVIIWWQRGRTPDAIAEFKTSLP